MNHSIHIKLLLGAGAVFAVLAALGVTAWAYLPILGLFAICSLVMMFRMSGSTHGGGSNSDGDRAEQPPSAHRH